MAFYVPRSQDNSQTTSPWERTAVELLTSRKFELLMMKTYYWCIRM